MSATADLLARLRQPDEGTRVVPSWVAPIFLGMSVLFVPWIVVLFLTLPEDYTAARWRLAWDGFDVGLAAALGATAILILSALTQTAAAVTAAFLVCDAWFDVLTSRGRDVWIAIALAVHVELPLAAFCIWIARSVERGLEDARPYLIEAGGSPSATAGWSHRHPPSKTFRNASAETAPTVIWRLTPDSAVRSACIDAAGEASRVSKMVFSIDDPLSTYADAATPQAEPHAHRRGCCRADRFRGPLARS